MMRDLTLIITTCNRATSLAALMGYLETEKADCRVLVLDSSCPETMAANRARLGTSSLDAEFAEFADTDPDEKLRQGIHRISTTFCAVCADDDLVVLDGVRRCLDALRGNPLVPGAQGSSFSFAPQPDGGLALENLCCFSSIDEESPLGRLAQFFDQNELLPIGGTFRTMALQRICDGFRLSARTFLCDLLWTGLTVIEGKVMRLPSFCYGRRLSPSASRARRHPLEWFCQDPDGLFAEYLNYRQLMASAVLRRPDNEQQSNDVDAILDLIHLRYLVRHSPDVALGLIAEQQMAGVDFAEYWPRHEIHLPIGNTTDAGPSAQAETLDPMKMRGRERSYILGPSFYAPLGTDAPRLSEIVGLIDALDAYRPASDEAAWSAAGLSARR
jgi:glycosyltransferase domain-containing protein